MKDQAGEIKASAEAGAEMVTETEMGISETVSNRIRKSMLK